jgi:hypothetical protein
MKPTTFVASVSCDVAEVECRATQLSGVIRIILQSNDGYSSDIAVLSPFAARQLAITLNSAADVAESTDVRRNCEES